MQQQQQNNEEVENHSEIINNPIMQQNIPTVEITESTADEAEPEDVENEIINDPPCVVIESVQNDVKSEVESEIVDENEIVTGPCVDESVNDGQQEPVVNVDDEIKSDPCVVESAQENISNEVVSKVDDGCEITESPNVDDNDMVKDEGLVLKEENLIEITTGPVSEAVAQDETQVVVPNDGNIEAVESVTEIANEQQTSTDSENEATEIVNDNNPEQSTAETKPVEDEETQKDTRTLLRYDEETAGGRMTTQIGKVLTTMTVKEAIDHLRDELDAFGTLARIFVVDLPGL